MKPRKLALTFVFIFAAVMIWMRFEAHAQGVPPMGTIDGVAIPAAAPDQACRKLQDAIRGAVRAKRVRQFGITVSKAEEEDVKKRTDYPNISNARQMAESEKLTAAID